MKHAAVSTLLAILMMLPLAARAQQPASAATPPAKIAANVNGEVITVAELDRLYDGLSPEMRENYDRAGGKAQFLDYLIRKKLVLQEAIKAGFDRRPDVQESLRTARESVLFDRYIRDVVAASIVTEADIRKYYEDNKVDFSRPPMIKVRHIIATPQDGPVTNSTGSKAKTPDEAMEKIKSLAAALQTGAKFADLAQQYSEDGVAMSGGDLGWVEPGRMVPEFERAAFALRKGELSGLVETQHGYHLIWVEDRRDGGIAPYDDVRGAIREELLAEKAQNILSAVNLLSQELRAQSTVMVHTENF
ncbi:MAG TPA: peptidylprolyl isomerase [Thermoanaerobaculia bacterium]|nr:peptidylprolyl isomerase [Thermoanaerobaculia bacterium]